MEENRNLTLVKNFHSDIKILSGDGKYHSFDGITISTVNTIVEIYFDDESFLECSEDHPIPINGEKILAKNVKIGDVLQTKTGSKTVIFKDKRTEKTLVFDPVNVGPTHTIYANDTLVNQCVLLDEFAHIETRVANDFYTSVYPVITSGKNTKIFMISTPKGMNLFYQFWIDAVNKKNNYIPFEVHWRDVPGRDQKWYEDTIKNIGAEKFRQEFEVEFLGSTNTLISGDKLQKLIAERRGPRRTLSEIDIYEEPIKEEWDDEGNRINVEHKYVICVDTSEGKKLDSSAFTVIDITQTPYKLVAKYKSNIIAPLLYPSIIWQAAKLYNDAYVLIESMTVGMQVADILHTDLEYEHIIRTASGNKKAQQVSEGYKPGSMMGVKTTAPVKRIGCQNLKTLIETDQLLLPDADVVEELTTFVLNNKGSYEADADCHDDLVMTLVLFSWLSTQKYFKELVTHDLRKQLRQQFLDFNDEEMLPAPIIVDGLRNRFLDGFDTDLWTTDSNTPYDDPYHDYFKAV